MVARNKPYEQFGAYILFRKLESDALGELFRAARIEGPIIGPMLAVRRLTGGDREALASAASTASQIAPMLTGSSFVRDQRIEVIGGTTVISHEYAAGRSLRTIIDRARAAGSSNPLPIDQALAIAERVALSLAATSEMRFAGERLVHGGLIPQFIWITEDGEIRVAGQGLGRGLAASLRNEKIASEVGRYFAPEFQHSGASSKSTEVYALGAILYLLVTGHEPPDATRTSAFTHAIRAAKTTLGAPVPDDIRTILEKSLNIDPAARYASPEDMRLALAALASSGKYAATSFNLAFYLSNLLKKEMETEAAERERESKVNIAAYALPASETAAAAVPIAASAEPGRSRAPMAIAATLALAAAGAGAWFLFLAPKNGSPAAKAPAANVASVLAPQAKEPIVAEPIIATPEPSAAAPAQVPAMATASELDEAAKQKAFEEAVKRRLQEELQKLQAQYTRELQQQSRKAPVVSTATQAPLTQPAVEERAVPAATLEQQRRDAAADDAAEAAPQMPPPAVATAAAPPPQPSAAQTQPAAPAVQQTVSIREGDVVDMNDLDQMPTAVRAPRPAYPPIAARQRIEATVMASVLISESGEVIDVKILRGDPRFGFNDAAIRAFRAARYTSPMKDGKRVRTWVAQMIQFKP